MSFDAPFEIKPIEDKPKKPIPQLIVPEESSWYRRYIPPSLLYPPLWIYGTYLQNTHGEETGPFGGSLICENLYLGGFSDAMNLKELKKVGVTHCLTVMYGVSPFYPNDFKYINIPVLDVDMESLEPYFAQTNLFIEDSVKTGKVFVHCRQGKSRSASIVIAYMMFKYKLKFHEALQAVRAKRPLISPNMGFCEQLKTYESFLDGKKHFA
jgi:protein-tyrosine phosphatase